MNLGKQQNLFFMEDLGASVQILAGLIGLIAVTCLCAYLLIYNIMYLSVTGKVRYYGLLQTVGMTEKQIKRMMKEQMLLIGSAGTSTWMSVRWDGILFPDSCCCKITWNQKWLCWSRYGSFSSGSSAGNHLLVGVTIFLASQKPIKMEQIFLQ